MACAVLAGWAIVRRAGKGVGGENRRVTLRMLCRISAALAVAAAVGGCILSDNDPPAGEPTFYRSLATSDAKLDATAAQSMITGYRKNNGLDAVTLDPQLMRLAEEQARAMATRDKLDHNIARPFTERLRAGGYTASVAVENISAGYHTMAEAF